MPSYVIEEEIKRRLNMKQKSFKIAEEMKIPLTQIHAIQRQYKAESRVREKEQEDRLKREANEREKAKIVETRQRKQESTDGKWFIPNNISKSTKLKLTTKQEETLIQLSFGMKAFTCYVLEATARKIQPDYELVKKFIKKNGKLGAKTLDVLSRTKIKSMIQSSIRKPRFSNFVIPFQGTHGNTTGNAKVVKKDEKFYLRFNEMDLEILFQDHDDYFDSGIETPLKQLFEKSETPSGEILKAKNKNWYARFSLKRKEPTIKFDENSKPVFMVVQPIFTQIGCKWIAYFYNELNQLVFKTTILKDVAWIRIPNIQKGFIKYYTDKASEQLIGKTWHRKFQTFKPIVILLDTIGTVPSQVVANLNPTYKFRFKIQDKLAQYDGDGYTLSNCSNNIDEIRARLSI